MKYQVLFTPENQEAVKNLSSAEVVIDILKVYDDTMLDYFLSLCN